MYSLELTKEDIDTIYFVGYRYGWSDTLMIYCDEGLNIIPENEAWVIKEAFEEDTEGGHSPFPMLDHNSELCEKLVKFWDEIV